MLPYDKLVFQSPAFHWRALLQFRSLEDKQSSRSLLGPVITLLREPVFSFHGLRIDSIGFPSCGGFFWFAWLLRGVERGEGCQAGLWLRPKSGAAEEKAGCGFLQEEAGGGGGLGWSSRSGFLVHFFWTIVLNQKIKVVCPGLVVGERVRGEGGGAFGVFGGEGWGEAVGRVGGLGKRGGLGSQGAVCGSKLH